jgi:hypothetical protein
MEEHQEQNTKELAPNPCQRCHEKYEQHTAMGHSMMCAKCCTLRNLETASVLKDKGFLLGVK